MKNKKSSFISLTVLMINVAVFGLANVAKAATETNYPSAPGDTTPGYGVHTPTTSYANWDCVNESSSDGLTTTVSASGQVELYDLYHISAPSSIKSSDIINSVTVYINSEGNGVGTNQAAPYIEENSVKTTDTLHTLTTSFAPYSKIWTNRPSDGLSWTYNDIVNLQIGVHSKGSRPPGPPSIEYTTQVYVVIDYTPVVAPHLGMKTQPSGGTASTIWTNQPEVYIQDADGNTVTNDSTTQVIAAILTNPGGGTLSGTTTVTAVNGIATFTNLKIDKAGTGYILTFTSIPELAGATSSNFNITAGSAVKLGMKTQPSGGTATTIWTNQPEVYIQDADGNTVTTNSATTVTAAIGTNPGSGTLFGTVTVTAVNGVAAFTDLNIYKTGTGYTLTFTSSPTFTPVTSSAFDITALAGACGDVDGDGVTDTPCACGNTVVGAPGYIYTLTNDLTCTGHGLVVGANGITINGNNHTITGDGVGTDYGINNSGGWDNITIENFGVTGNSGISSFNSGIYLNNSTGSIIKNNIVNSNTTDGIYLNNSSNNYLGLDNTPGSSNTASLNGFSGIYISGGSGNRLNYNTANLNIYGIYLYSSSSNTLTNNTVNSNMYGIQLASSPSNNITGNTADSNMYGTYLYFSSLNTLTGNKMLMNIKDFYDDQIINNTYSNDQFLHNAISTMLSFVETSTPGIKTVNSTISFTVTAKKPDGTACTNCTTITTSPSETVTIDSEVDNTITGHFVPTKLGVYSLDIQVTDSTNSNVANITQRNCSFLVGATGTQTVTYYYRGINPTHGQPAGHDAKSLLKTPPTSTETWLCTEWVQNSPDELPDYPLASLSLIDSYTWYKQIMASGAYIGVQRYLTYTTVVDTQVSVPATNYYSWVDNHFTNLNWAMDYPQSWYWLSLKLNGSNPFEVTFPATESDADPASWAVHHHDGVTDASYADFTYRYTTTPAVKSISNTDINILSATAPTTDTNDATIVLENPTAVATSTSIVLNNYKRPFQDYATTISLDGATPVATIAANNIAAGARATLGSVKLDVTPDTGTITISNITWNTSDTYSKQWTESGAGGVSSVSHTVGDLSSGTYYTVWYTKDGGTKTPLTTLQASSSQITFNYNQGYSDVIFDVDPTSVPTVTTVAATNITTTTATGNGNITATGGENASIRGVEWGTASGGPYTSATETNSFGTGAFTGPMTGLSPGTTYYYRAKAYNDAGWGYGSEQSFTNLPGQVTVVSATDGTHTDKVTVTWTKSTGATGYKVYEGVNLLATLGDVATYDDVTAPAPTITPGSAAAGDGTAAAHVALSLSGASVNSGASRTYKVVAFNATGDSEDSPTDTGYRGAGSLTCQWQRSAADSDASYSDISGATNSTYNDTGAPIYTVNAPTSVSVSAPSADVLSITFSGASITAGAGRYYRYVLNATGASEQISTSNRGYRNDTIATANGYEVFSDTSSGGAYSTSEGITSVSPFEDTGLSINTRKYYKVKAMSTAGTWSSLSTAYDGKYTLPLLAIAFVGTNSIVVSWPSPFTGFVLQQNPNLTTASWSNFNGTVNDNGIIKSVTNNLPTNHMFFRLTSSGLKCAYANVFDRNGVQMLTVNGLNNDNGFLSSTSIFAYGRIYLQCPTPGAVIHFQFENPYGNDSAAVLTGGSIIDSYSAYIYAAGSVMPVFTGPNYIFLKVWVTAAGYADGDILTVYILGHS